MLHFLSYEVSKDAEVSEVSGDTALPFFSGF
jgi:hypothetical protein